ncbi:uncharacterized protein CEXT_794871 [Caerostris extrusa]|uniref:F-box/LRR-repeat protein n=1 Tax=Caerostris extrusa TaxID=172846 RepID=A0AAV4Q5L9_CAEEX|nr:uncharacterized protein CEXT_794871 [Caerostris extrusa]
MSNDKPSLYRLCVWKTACLLKDSYWDEVYGVDGTRNNPFLGFPTNIIQDLLDSVLNLASKTSLKVTDLYYLLTSGRIEHFKLEEILLKSDDFISIIMSLSVACQKLQSLKLDKIFFTDHYMNYNKTKGYMKRAALECVLSISPNLVTVESCIEFDLKAIRNCENLKVLKLNFLPITPLFQFLEEDYEIFWPNNSLMILEVVEDVRHFMPYMELAIVLKYCTALKEVNVDICKSLQYLHGQEMYDGTLDTKYGLQKCYLGNAFEMDGYATREGVHLATLTCPEMKDVTALVCDNDVIYAISNFPDLKRLVLQWDSVHGGDFRLGVSLALSKIGLNLKSLFLCNFYDVDFSVIAACCPLLEELSVEYLSEYCGWEESQKSFFEKLKYLNIELIIDTPEAPQGCSEKTLILLLSSCRDLVTLYLKNAACLSDSVLTNILEKNSLLKVSDAKIIDSRLSDNGVGNLITHLAALDFFCFSSSHISFEDAAEIVHMINPQIILTSEEF